MANLEEIKDQHRSAIEKHYIYYCLHCRHWHGTGPALARHWPGTAGTGTGTGPAR